MGSKRSSSKNPNKAPSSPTPTTALPEEAAHLPDENRQNPQNPPNPSIPSSSKSRKKQKVSSSISPVKSILNPIPSADGEAPSQNNGNKGKSPDISNEISLNNSSVLNRSRWEESDVLLCLKAIDAFRTKQGFLPNAAHMKDFLNEIKNWAPGPLSEKHLWNKIRHFRFKFQKSPTPGPESSVFDRAFHEFGSRLWGPSTEKVKDSATYIVKGDSPKGNDIVEGKDNRKVMKDRTSKKLNGKKKDVDGDKEDEDGIKKEIRVSEDDDDSDEKAAKGMGVENGEEHEKGELPVVEGCGLVDGDEGGYPYKYLKLALEEYWTEAKLNMDTLYSALPKVDSVQAKRLDEQFLEIFESMLKLKMEKNKVSNEIILASLNH